MALQGPALGELLYGVRPKRPFFYDRHIFRRPGGSRKIWLKGVRHYTRTDEQLAGLAVWQPECEKA